MKRAKQVLVVVLANLILLFLVFETNSLLSSLSLYITVGGLLVVFPALKLPFEQGILCVFITGLCWDVLVPVPFGFFAFTLSLICVALYHLRHRLRSQRKLYLTFTAFVANLVIIAICWLIPGGAQLSIEAVLRTTVELLLSQAIVLLAGYWFFELQENSLIYLGALPTGDEMA